MTNATTLKKGGEERMREGVRKRKREKERQRDSSKVRAPETR